MLNLSQDIFHAHASNDGCAFNAEQGVLEFFHNDGCRRKWPFLVASWRIMLRNGVRRGETANIEHSTCHSSRCQQKQEMKVLKPSFDRCSQPRRIRAA